VFINFLVVYCIASRRLARCYLSYAIMRCSTHVNVALDNELNDVQVVVVAVLNCTLGLVSLFRSFISNQIKSEKLTIAPHHQSSAALVTVDYK